PLREADLRELRDDLLGLRRADGEGLGQHEPILAHELRKDRAERAAIHLAVDLLVEITRTRRKRPAAANPDRAARRAVTGTARALLAPRLRTAAPHLGTGLLRLRARARSGHIGDDDLMNERLVERRRERSVGELHRLPATV